MHPEPIQGLRLRSLWIGYMSRYWVWVLGWEAGIVIGKRYRALNP